MTSEMKENETLTASQLRRLRLVRLIQISSPRPSIASVSRSWDLHKLHHGDVSLVFLFFPCLCCDGKPVREQAHHTQQKPYLSYPAWKKHRLPPSRTTELPIIAVRVRHSRSLSRFSFL